MEVHTKNSHESNREKHENGDATRKQDAHGGEKADSKRIQYRTYVQPKDKKN